MSETNERERCAFCDAPALEPARLTMSQSEGGVEVTVTGVPGVRCQRCGEAAIVGPRAFALDDALRAVLVAAGALPASVLEQDVADVIVAPVPR
jgi:YgiT-type zinc finger domain-containing protein